MIVAVQLRKVKSLSKKEKGLFRFLCRPLCEPQRHSYHIEFTYSEKLVKVATTAGDHEAKVELINILSLFDVLEADVQAYGANSLCL